MMKKENIKIEIPLNTLEFKEEEIPGVMMKNDIGEQESHKVVEGKYVPEVEANVIFQQRKVLAEYRKLERYKKEVERSKNRKDIVRRLQKKNK